MLKLINLDDTFIGLHGKMGGFTIYTEIDVGEEDGELEVIRHNCEFLRSENERVALPLNDNAQLRCLCL